MISALIPSYRQVQGNHGKHYTVFQIEVYSAGKCYKVEHRYRAFHSLHKQLKHIICAPEFPPKKVRNLNPKVLEQRRKGLENYIQELLKRKPVPKQLLTFLSLPSVSPSSSVKNPNLSKIPVFQRNPILNKIPVFQSSFSMEENRESIHQPVMMYSPNLYIEEDRNSSLPDIVGKGLLMAFYSSDEETD